MDKQWATRFLEHPPNKKLKKPVERMCTIVEIAEKAQIKKDRGAFWGEVAKKRREIVKVRRKELCKEVTMATKVRNKAWEANHCVA